MAKKEMGHVRQTAVAEAKEVLADVQSKVAKARKAVRQGAQKPVGKKAKPKATRPQKRLPRAKTVATKPLPPRRTRRRGR